MNNLQLVALENEQYREAVIQVQAEAQTLEQAAAVIATGLVADVLAGNLSLTELRGGVVWANALDREAVGVAPTDAITREESLARRIMHKAGRAALDQVKTENRRIRLRCSALGSS